MVDQDSKIHEALEGLDQDKRDTLNRLVAGSAFVVPVVASFAMQGFAIRPAEAQSSNTSDVV